MKLGRWYDNGACVFTSKYVTYCHRHRHCHCYMFNIYFVHGIEFDMNAFYVRSFLLHSLCDDELVKNVFCVICESCRHLCNRFSSELNKLKTKRTKSVETKKQS